MNQRRRLSILGLAIAIISLSIIGAVAAEADNDNEIILDIEYFQQKHPRFCGQATSQMAINAILGRGPSQWRLLPQKKRKREPSVEL